MTTQDPDDDDTGIDAEELRETDKDRREAMMTSMDTSEANQLRIGTLSDSWGDFILPKRSTPEGYGTGETEDHLSPRGKPQRAGHTSIATFMASGPARSGGDCDYDPDPDPRKSRPGKTTQEGLWREERGSVPHRVTKPLNTTDSTLSNSQQSLNVARARENEEITKWSCLVCTLSVSQILFTYFSASIQRRYDISERMITITLHALRVPLLEATHTGQDPCNEHI